MLPLLLTAGLMGASTIANKFAQNKVGEARGKVTRQEQARQAGWDAEIGALNTGAQDRYSGFGDALTAKQAALATRFAEAKAGAPGVLPVSTSPAVAGYEATERPVTDAYSAQQGDALAKLMSWAEAMGATSRAQARDASQINQLGGFKRGSAGVTPIEYEGANTAGGNLRLLGDALALAGQVTGMKALGGGTTAIGAPIVANPVTGSNPWAARIVRG